MSFTLSCNNSFTETPWALSNVWVRDIKKTIYISFQNGFNWIKNINDFLEKYKTKS